MRWWAITRVELVRLFRDRGNIFFVLIFPLLLVVLIGASFGSGGAGARTGVVGDPAVARGGPVEVSYVGRQDGNAASLQAVVQDVIGDRSAIADAASAAADATGRPLEETSEVAGTLAGQLPGIDVTATELAVEGGLEQEFAGLGQFDLGASSQLFLFTFLTALAGGAALIQTRQYGVARRMLSTSTPPGVVLPGMAAGRIGVAVFQAAYIVIVTSLVFGVNWGDPLATTVVVLLFCLVAGGAGMLVGATLRNDSQASGVGVGVGLGLAALGGSMVPLEVFPGPIRQVANITPHAWANQAMAELVRRDGTLGDVLTEVAVLAGFAVVLLVLATVLLQRNLTR
ncbi:MAG: ABC transporter permease [Nitriliruptor sp.]